jgi:YVTN family beta-propeller protein
VITVTGQTAVVLESYGYTVITVTGQTAVVLESYGYTVILIDLKTRHVIPPIAVGAYPTAVAIT